MSRRILVVDDEPSMRHFLCDTLNQMDDTYDVDAVSDGYEALDKMSNAQYDLVVTDYMMPQLNGLELLREMQSHETNCDVVMMTAYESISNAVEAMKLGAIDYLMKPFTVEHIEALVERVLGQPEVPKTDESALRSEFKGYHEIVGFSSRMQQIYDLLTMVAPTKATVLISGESGTGKELVARAVHFKSGRHDGPFIKINCAAMPEHLIESELFGHEKGAFTGAIKQNKGKFELAHGGTLLLDEISEMALPLQSKLLRVLQEREIERLGGQAPISVDARIVATTNRNLQEEVKEGRFREDLYYRLNVVPVQLPSLRERKSDIPTIAQHFIKKICLENGKRLLTLSDDALTELQRYHWPGNVRELENRIERAVIICNDTELSPKHLLFDSSETQDTQTSTNRYDIPDRPMTMRETEKALILKTLKEFNGNRMKTSEALQISVRTLRNKLNEYRKTGEFGE